MANMVKGQWYGLKYLIRHFNITSHKLMIYYNGIA